MMVHQSCGPVMTKTALDIMTSPAIIVAPTASLAEIVTLLIDNRISAVLVCDPDGKLVGVVSERDILRPLQNSGPTHSDWWIKLISEGKELSQAYMAYLRLDTRTARDLMAHDVVTATANATIPRLAELMVKHGIDSVPILDGPHVVGVVSRSELLAAVASRRTRTRGGGEATNRGICVRRPRRGDAASGASVDSL
jgi:CBS domain-containing protein